MRDGVSVLQGFADCCREFVDCFDGSFVRFGRSCRPYGQRVPGLGRVQGEENGLRYRTCRACVVVEHLVHVRIGQRGVMNDLPVNPEGFIRQGLLSSVTIG